MSLETKSDSVHRRRLGRLLWLPVLLSIGVLLLPGRAASITSANGFPAPNGFDLFLPSAYVLTSPLSRILDALTLLSNPQSIAAFVTFAALVFGWQWLAHGGVTWRTWVVRLTTLVVIVAIIEATVAFAPRPMARLVSSNTGFVTVDFHSHTGASHDVRKSVSAEDNRDWHASSGFNAAYITDHVTFDGAVKARRNNPRAAGDGVSLLTGVEGRYHKIMSTIMLGLDERDVKLLNKRGNLLPGTPARGTGPLTIVALPNRNLDSVTIQSLDSIPHFAAIELIDAAPRGLGQFDREEARIRSLASQLHLTLVAASNNHGFGRTAAAWNIIELEGWQTLTPEQLASSLEQSIRSNEVGIIMRTRPRTHDASLVFTLPSIAYLTLASLTNPERVSWLVWIWVIAAVVAFFKLRRPSSTS
jgi:hypothetical protein